MKIFLSNSFNWVKGLSAGIILAFSFANLEAQTFNYTKNALNVDVIVSNPCGGSTTNGSITFKVNGSNNGATILTVVSGPNETVFPGVTISDGGTFIYTPIGPDQGGDYDFIIHDNINTINTFPAGAPFPVTMVDLTNIVINQVTLTDNSNCTAPNGQVVASVSGGSKSPALSVPGSFKYKWTSNNGLAGLPLTSNYDGTGNLDLAVLLGTPGLPGGTYTLLITDNYSVCTQTQNFVIIDPSPIVYNVTTTTPSVCIGSGGTVNLSNSEGAAITYEIFKGGVATGITLTGTNAPLVFAIPPAQLTPVASYGFTIRAVNGFCTPVFMTGTATITVNPNNTIALTSAVGTNNQTKCVNTAITNITYATTGATGATFSGLPAGVTGNWAANVATISGTPTATGVFNYTVTMTGGCPGGTNTANGSITVKPNNTITLTSAAGTDNQTKCVSVAITNITYATTGATGATFSGLPTGVTGNWAANVATISGTPTATGVFNYTVTMTGGCPGGTNTANGSITVNPNNTITLTSAAGTNNQTRCVNVAITNITYATTGATGATFSGLPTGVTGNWAANVATISGTPTATGVFNYTVTMTGGCPGGTNTANGSITVKPNNTITLTSAAGTDNQTKCVSVAITNITYATTGATGATFSGLPTGVTGNWAANVATISGTPTATGVFNYTVTMTGGCPGGTNTANGSITVNPNNTITLTSAAGTDSQAACINVAITNITYATTGATGATFSGLPTGVTGNWAANVATISGIPTATGVFNYTVTMTGGCPGGTNTANGSITVKPNNTITLTSAAGTDNQTKCVSTAITNITYATTGATGATFSGLPGGVTGNWAANVATISGTPTATGVFNYTVTMTGGCPGGTNTANGSITVNPNNTITLSSAAGTDSQAACINVAITNITYATTGATGATFSGLPGGVTGNWAANVATISGTPTATGVFNYTVTMTGGCPGGTNTANGSITVKPNNTITLTSAAGTDNQTKCVSVAITNITYATTGATGATFSGLPTGVTGNWAANVATISGTPTATGVFNYTVTMTGGCPGGTNTANGSITVNPNNTITLTSAAGTDSQAACINVAITNITYATTGATGATFSGLPTGVTGNWAANVATISGTPTATGVFNYTVTMTGGCPGGTNTANGSITVKPNNTITLTSAAGTDNQTKCVSVAITNITYATTGATGATFSGLPTGVTGNWAANVATISGTPTATGVFNYTVTMTGGCPGGTNTADGSITVNPNNTITLSSAAGTDNQAACVSTPITNITYTTTSATGATFSGLPTGVTGNWAANVATISGTPTATGVFNYTVTMTGGCTGGTNTANGTITVNPVPNATINPAGPFCLNDAPTNLTAVTAGGTWSGTGITDTSLGTFDPSVAGVGVHSITYTVTVGGCTSTKSRNIRVNAIPDATITPAGPFCLADPTTNLTAATGGGTWSGTGIVNAATGSFDPATAGAGTFIITYSVTVGGCTDTKTTSITVGNSPDATITPAGPFCTNAAAVTLTAATAGGTWSGTGITNAATGAFDPATAGAGTFTITYSITIGGCSDTKTTPITVNAAPDATITPAGPFCTTDAPVTLAAATGGGTWSGTGITNTATGAFDPATAGAGTFSISYSVTLGSCTDNKSINITVANPPDATITPAGPFCTNAAAVTLTAATAGGTWSGTGITNAATGAFDPATAGAGTFTITYSITIGGCSDTKTTPITVNAAPDATITPAGPFCTTDAPVTLAAATGGGTWSGTGITNTATGAFDPATAGAGTFSISYSVTLGSCTDNKSINITVANPPDATITPAGPFCTNAAAVTLTAATAGGTWSGTGITNAATGAFDPATAGAGTFTITYSITIGGCSDTKTTPITVNAAPDATITPAGPFCVSSPATNLTASLPGGTWSGTGITSAINGTFDPSVSGVGSFTITYSVTSGSCTTNATTTIQVNASCGGTNCGAFTILATDTRPTCSGQDDGTITISVSGGTPNYVVTLSDPSQGFSQALAGPGPFTFINLSPSLTYTYTILDNVNNTCTLPYSLPIQTNVNASAAGFVDAKCFNQAVGQATVTVTSGGTSPYEYSLDAGTTWTSFTSPVTITNLMPALIPYSILVRDDASDLCPAQVSVTINNAVTDISTLFTATDASCSNNDGTIQVGAVSGGTGPYTYRLDSVDYAALPASNTFTGLAGGTHKFTVIDANGCSKYFKTNINFPGLVNFTTIFNNPDCFSGGNNGNVIATITSSGTFDVGITTDPVNDPTVFQTVVSAGFSQVTFNNLSQGTYFVVAKPVGALCPSRSAPIAIGGGPAAVDFNIIPEDFVCFETKGMVRIAGIKGSTLVDYNYEIIFAGSIIQSGTINQLQALPPDTINYTGLDKGNYQMRLFQDQSAASGCASPISSSYKSFSINGPAASLDTLYVNRKFSLPNIATGSMLIGIQESQAQPYQLMLHLVTPHLQGQTNNYAFDSTWVSVSRNNQNLIMEFNAANIYGGDYRLSIRDTLGCTRTYDLSLDFDKDIYVPNVFTPNNDGKNDTFQILNLPDDSKLVITNRWGKEVYRSSNYTNNWNGGSEVDGVYYYSLVAGGKTYTGWVEIMHPSF